MLWITRNGFKRYQKRVDKKTFSFSMNLITWPLKLFFWTSIVDRKIEKSFRLSSGDWNKIRRNDPWTNRAVEYDIDLLIESNIDGIKIYINNEYKNELVNTFGSNWKIEKESVPHFFSKSSNLHERNIQIEETMKGLYN